MSDIAISTAAFCLWDIGPARKLEICRDLGFERIVIAFSTIKMLKHFASSSSLCEKLSEFGHVTVHAPWCGISYKKNKATNDVFAYLDTMFKKIQFQGVIFHFDCIKDWDCFEDFSFPYYIKNPSQASWQTFNDAIKKHDFKSVLDINRAVRFENYIDKYLVSHKEQINSVHVSGFIDDLGRTPIAESGQIELLDRIHKLSAPVVIEGLFSPGDFQGIREEIDIIKNAILG